jgi:anti-sigma factor (TIGR02949 family)
MIRWFRRPNDLSCQDVAQLLQHYLDAEVEDGTASQVSVHLGGCEHCGVEYEVYQQIKVALVERAQAPVDPAVLGALRQFCDDLVGHDEPPTDRPS